MVTGEKKVEKGRSRPAKMEVSRGARSEADTNGGRFLRGQGSDPGMGPKRGQNGEDHSSGQEKSTGRLYQVFLGR